jgi:hypothetical protein
LEDTYPALFVLLGAGSQRQYFFVTRHIHSQCCEDHGRIGLPSVTHAEMDAIEIKNTPVLLQPALAPGSELLLEILVEPADGTGTWGHSQQGLGHCSYFVGAGASDEHVGQALSHLGLIAAVTLKDLGVEPAFTIAGHLQVPNPTRGGYQITGVGAVAIAFAAAGYSLPSRPQ